jgi:Mg2+ and Co2+ transporter CorA
MRWIAITATRAETLDAEPMSLPADGFVWLDVLHDEVIADPEALRGAIERVSGVRIFDLHLQDAANLQHPSYFDSTNEYDMLVFRKLAMAESRPLEERPARADQRRTLQEIVTRPITFFLLDRMLVTVRQESSRTVEQIHARLMEVGNRTVPASPLEKTRLPARPGELMLRMLNQMVDRYLELRETLSERLDRWQRELIDPRRPFSNWTALLEARIELRRLENLSEGQYDALTELRDTYLEETPDATVSDAYLVRLNDVMEHIQRVLHHARRLEASAESAVQLHFSATTHRTNQILRTLTAVAAIFAPLTLITGFFGMNFEKMPWIREGDGVWWTLGLMAAVSVALLLYFWTRRILERPRTPRPPRWLR